MINREELKDPEEVLEQVRLLDFLNAFIQDLKPKLNRVIHDTRKAVCLTKFK